METAAIAFLKQNNISYSTMEYPENGPIAAKDVAAYFHFGDETDRLFKNIGHIRPQGRLLCILLTRRKKLDLKRAASLVGVKNLQMVEPDIFQSLTGYTHGGCSPFGMKTQLPTIVERSALNWGNHLSVRRENWAFA